MKHKRRRKRNTGRTAAKVIALILLILALITAGVMYLRERVETEYASDDIREAVSAIVKRGSISTSVYGSGLLTDDDEERFTIPENVELEEIYVQAGDKVSEGDLFASVNLNSVLTAMNALDEEIAALDTEINTASIQSAYGYISSSVNGRVKMIYAQKGDVVADVMRQHGALMLLSLDGYMAMDVEISGAELSTGDAVTLVSESGLSYPGRVSEIIDGAAKILITDQGTVFGDRMSLVNSAGQTLGSGTLYINQPLKIMGYTGIVDYVNVHDNSVVYSGSTLLSLAGMDNSAKYEGLLRERAELEDEMGKLINIYRDGAIYFDLSGTVKAINASDAEDRAQEEADAATGASAESTGTADLEYYTVSPDKSMSVSLNVDETDILSLSPGQKASVSVDALEDESFEGTVTGIDRIGTSSNGVTSFTALVTIEKTEKMLAGMSASATINIDGVENALIIPLDALNKTSTSCYVYTSLAEDGSLSGMKEVSTGISNAQYVEILEGLSEGDRVYYYESEEAPPSFGGSMGGVPGGNMGGVPGGNMGGMPGGNMGGMPGGMARR